MNWFIFSQFYTGLATIVLHKTKSRTRIPSNATITRSIPHNDVYQLGHRQRGSSLTKEIKRIQTPVCSALIPIVRPSLTDLRRCVRLLSRMWAWMIRAPCVSLCSAFFDTWQHSLLLLQCRTIQYNYNATVLIPNGELQACLPSGNIIHTDL